MELIGHVTVDAGMVMVGDPCYLDDFVRQGDAPVDFGDAAEGAYSYSGACHATLETEHRAGVLGEGLAVAASTGFGDGTYPVYVTMAGGRVASLTVVFIGEDGDLDEDEDEDSYDEEECDRCGRVVDLLVDGLCNACREDLDSTEDELVRAGELDDEGGMPDSFGG